MKTDIIYITGATGQLGQTLRTVPFSQTEVHFLNRDALDLSDPLAVESYFAERPFTALINAAAYTAVDKAESEPEAAEAINHTAVAALAKIAKKNGALLIHISTDYVFDGTMHRPYVESDPVAPGSVYGRSKRRGEEAILQSGARAVILRTSWLYSPYGRNFLKTMLRLGEERPELGVVFDQVGTPTYARDLAVAIHAVVAHASDITAPELYHFSNEGVAGWYDFAEAIFELSGTRCHVRPITTSEYPTPAERPHYSLLDKSAFKQRFSQQIPHWRDGLKRCLEAMA